MDKLKAKWTSLTRRERLLVSIGSIAVLILLVYYLLLAPLLTAVDNVKMQSTAQQNLLVWMQPRVGLLQSRSSSTSAGQAITASELLPTVDARLKQSDFAGSVGEISQTSTSGVRVALTNVPFDELMTWLTSQWQRSRIQVGDIDVQKTNKVGIVDVTLTLVVS
jgi:type II secretory pathway component PulM